MINRARPRAEDARRKGGASMKRHAMVLGAALLLAASSLPAWAQQKLVLKATDVHPLGYPTVEAVVRMGKKLEQATGGRLSIQMYPSMQLGGEKEMIEQAQVGALAIARISVGPMGPIVPEMNVFNLPFMFRDDAHMEKVIDGPIGDELLKKLSDSQANLIGLCWMNAGTRNVYNSKKPIQRIDDPDDGQPRIRRYDELPRRQWRVDGLRSAYQCHADRRGRRRGEQLSDLRERTALPLREVLLEDRPPDDPGDPRLLEKDLERVVKGRSGVDPQGRQGSPARGTQTLVRPRKGLSQEDGRVRGSRE